MSEPQVNVGQLPAPPGAVLLGKYRVDRAIGAGGMGVVALGWHLDFDERIAIKFLLPALADNAEAVGRFEREARVLFKIKSENVCRVIDVGKLESGVPFMIMEYLDGHDLATALESGEPLPIDRAIEYGMQACQALAHAHVRGIVHRDIKPENLFVARDPSGEHVLKLLDFGLSKEQESDEGGRKRKLTAQEQVMGTPHYMSPEQWLASTAVGPATDQWALAAIVFELVTGKPPFDGPQIGNVCSAIINAPTPSAKRARPDAPAGLDAVLQKALEKNPGDRYENIGAFAVALAAFAAPGVAVKAERTLKMLQQSDVEQADISADWPRLRSPPAASDMAATMRTPPKLDGLERERTDTSTSWQSWHRQRSSTIAAVGLGALAMVAVTAVAFYVLTEGPSGATPADTASATTVTREPTSEGPDHAGEPSHPTVVEAPAPDSSHAALGAPAPSSTSAATTPKPTRSTGARPKPSPQKPKPNGESLFDERK